MIALRRLARENLDARHPVGIRVVPDFLPVRDGFEDIEMLALVFVHPLDLDVEHGFGIEVHPVHPRHIVAKRGLVGVFHIHITVEPALILDGGFEFFKLFEVSDPVLANGLRDQTRKRRIARMQPAARRDPVGLVDNPVGMQRVEFLEHGLFHQIGVQSRDPVHTVGHDEGQLAHLHLPVGTRGERAVRVGLVMRVVNAVDDVQMARQKPPEQPLVPPLQRLRQKRVVGVVHTMMGDVERLFKGQSALVMQDPQKLRSCNRRVRVVELDRDLFRQEFQIVVVAVKAAQDVADRGGGEEIFLFETQFLARLVAVFGIEHTRNGARQCLMLGGGREVTGVEQVQIEGINRTPRPEPQRVGPAPLPADDGRVEGFGLYHLGGPPDGFAVLEMHIPAKADVDAHFGPFEFPRVRFLQPCFRTFDLTAVDKALFEQAVLVADAIAIGRTADGRETVEETGGQSPQPAIAQRRVRFVIQNGAHIHAEGLQRFFRLFDHFQIENPVLKQTPDQKFHREVINPLAVLFVGLARRGHPSVHDSVADCMAERHPPVEGLRMFRILAHRVGEMSQQGIAEIGGGLN